MAEQPLIQQNMNNFLRDGVLATSSKRKSSVSKFSFMKKRLVNIPGLEASILPQHTNSSHTKSFKSPNLRTGKQEEEKDKDGETLEVSDETLYGACKEDGEIETDDSQPQCIDNEYIKQIDIEALEFQPRVTEKNMSPGKSTLNSLDESTSMIIQENLGKCNTEICDPYVDVDRMTLPPVYSKLLKEGCKEEVAKKFLLLVQDGLLGNTEWDSDHGDDLLKCICRRSHGKKNIIKFFDEYISVNVGRSGDKFDLFRKMFNRFCKGYKNYREDKAIPLEVQHQTRIDNFYSSDIAKDYKVFVKPGCRRLYKKGEEEDDHHNDCHQLFIGRIPKYCYEDELFLHFCSIGTIKSIVLLMNCQSNDTRGFGFLNYEDETIADKAVEKFDQSFIRMNKRIGLTRGMNHNRLFFAGILRHLTEEDILKDFKAIFSGVTQIILNKDFNDRSKNRGFVFVDFDSSTAAREAIKKAKSGRYKIGGKALTNGEWARVLDKPVESDEVVVSSQSRRIFIRGLTSDVTEEAIYLSLIWHGEIDQVRKQGDYAFVTFKTHEGALSAVNNPPSTIAGTEVTIKWAAPSKKKFNDYTVPKNKGASSFWAPPNSSRASSSKPFPHRNEISRRRKSRTRKGNFLKRLSTNQSGALSHRNVGVTISERPSHVSSRCDSSQHTYSSSYRSRATDFDDALANYQSLIRHG